MTGGVEPQSEAARLYTVRVDAIVGAKGKPAYPFGVLQLVFQIGYALARLPCTLAGRRTQRLDGKPLLAAFAPPGLRAGELPLVIAIRTFHAVTRFPSTAINS